MTSQTPKLQEIGCVVAFYSGVGKIRGLPFVQMHETLQTEDGETVALVIGYDDATVDALFL